MRLFPAPKSSRARREVTGEGTRRLCVFFRESERREREKRERGGERREKNRGKRMLSALVFEFVRFLSLSHLLILPCCCCCVPVTPRMLHGSGRPVGQVKRSGGCRRSAERKTGNVERAASGVSCRMRKEKLPLHFFSLLLFAVHSSLARGGCGGARAGERGSVHASGSWGGGMGERVEFSSLSREGKREERERERKERKKKVGAMGRRRSSSIIISGQSSKGFRETP